MAALVIGSMSQTSFFVIMSLFTLVFSLLFMRMKEPLPHLEYKRSSGVRVSDLTFEEDELTDDEE